MKNQLVFKNHENGFKVAKMLLDDGKVVMLSYEEEFLVLNWEWCESGYADRNEIVFMSRWEFEETLDNHYEDIITDVAKDFANGTLANRLAPRIEKFKNDISSI